MTLRYDFDICRELPEAVFADPGLADGDARSNQPGAYRALFRDPRTAEALRNASPNVRDLFDRSGFGFTTYDSGAPTGHYPAQDEDSRANVIAKLAENLFEADLSGEDFNGFDFAEFLDLVDMSEPIQLDPQPATPPLSPGLTDPVPNMAPALDYDPWAEPKKGAKVDTLGVPGMQLDPGEQSMGSKAMMRAEVRTEMKTGGITSLLGSPGKAFGALAAFVGLIYLIKA
jgi:hypothetical protein